MFSLKRKNLYIVRLNGCLKKTHKKKQKFTLHHWSSLGVPLQEAQRFLPEAGALECRFDLF